MISEDESRKAYLEISNSFEPYLPTPLELWNACLAWAEPRIRKDERSNMINAYHIGYDHGTTDGYCSSFPPEKFSPEISVDKILSDKPED